MRTESIKNLQDEITECSCETNRLTALLEAIIDYSGDGNEDDLPKICSLAEVTRDRIAALNDKLSQMELHAGRLEYENSEK